MLPLVQAELSTEQRNFSSTELYRVTKGRFVVSRSVLVGIGERQCPAFYPAFLSEGSGGNPARIPSIPLIDVQETQRATLVCRR